MVPVDTEQLPGLALVVLGHAVGGRRIVLYVGFAMDPPSIDSDS